MTSNQVKNGLEWGDSMSGAPRAVEKETSRQRRSCARWVFPQPARYVSRRTPKFDEFILERGTVVFQAAGQIYGLFGRPLYVNGWLEGAFCADDVFRISPFTEIDGAFLYLFLRTRVGEALIKRQACGNSIPRVWEPHISRLRVLWPDPSVRESFAKPVIEAHEMIEQARQAELKAIRMLEQKIRGES